MYLLITALVLYDIFQFRSSYEIKKVKVPTLFLSGLADQLIPSAMMMELYQVQYSDYCMRTWLCVKVIYTCRGSPSTFVVWLYYFIQQACGAPLKHIETFQGGTHNGTWTCYGYYDNISKFVNYVSCLTYLKLLEF